MADEHPNRLHDVVPNHATPSALVGVVHPLLPLRGRIWVPRYLFEQTAGLVRADYNIGPRLTVCLLHRNLRCRAGLWCNQAHINPIFLQQLELQFEPDSKVCRRRQRGGCCE